MRAGLWAGVGMLVGCSGAPAAPSNVAAASSASVPEPDATPAPEPEAARAPEPEPEPEPEPVVDAGVATGPTKLEALEASRAVLDGKLAQLAPILVLADGRAAVLWRKHEDVGEASVNLVVLARSDGTWVAQSQAKVVRVSTPWLGGEDPPPIAVTFRSEDYDDDGAPELLVRTRVPEMCPGGGPNEITQLEIFDLDPTLEAVLATELRHEMEANPGATTKATVSHEDLDGDGHRDVEIIYRWTSDDRSETATNVWTYVPDKDAWVLRKPEYERWGCEW